MNSTKAAQVAFAIHAEINEFSLDERRSILGFLNEIVANEESISGANKRAVRDRLLSAGIQMVATAGAQYLTPELIKLIRKCLDPEQEKVLDKALKAVEAQKKKWDKQQKKWQRQMSKNMKAASVELDGEPLCVFNGNDPIPTRSRSRKS